MHPARCLRDPGNRVPLNALLEEFEDRGFVVLPGYLDAGILADALGEIEQQFPSGSSFHDGTDPRVERYRGNAFAGVDRFPFESVELSMLVVDARIVQLARGLLGTEQIRLYAAEAWAKYTGAADYEQVHHRDYLNHTILVPSSAPEFRQLEMFVYLTDVDTTTGAMRLVPRSVAEDIAAVPNWYPPADEQPVDRFHQPMGSAELYEREVAAVGPAGTIVAYTTGTLHRGTAMTAPRGARFTLHLNFRPASAEWALRTGWAGQSHDDRWYRFASRCDPEQLELFGVPQPGHRFWTQETVDRMALRYPGLDLGPWRDALDSVER